MLSVATDNRGDRHRPRASRWRRLPRVRAWKWKVGAGGGQVHAVIVLAITAGLIALSAFELGWTWD